MATWLEILGTDISQTWHLKNILSTSASFSGYRSRQQVYRPLSAPSLAYGAYAATLVGLNLSHRGLDERARVSWGRKWQASRIICTKLRRRRRHFRLPIEADPTSIYM